jgi:pyruvate ferredoxin oxidoreductase gamma subunit
MKTASRVVGTAAFRQGFYAQDSPVYGAERRGAPMVAFTRFDEQPILERGFVTNPNFVVIADESLLADPLVRPMQGLLPSGTVLMNSRRAAAELRSRYTIPNAIASADFTSLALRHAGSVVALSVALGAAAAKLAGMESLFVETAVREELEALSLDPKRVDRNLDLARASCDAVIATNPPGILSSESADVEGSVQLVTPVYRGGWAGTASVAAAPNTPLRRTGDWRVSRPIIDLGRCTHCWICFVNCPDGAIALTGNDVPDIDYDVCKGCMLCVEECPVDAIESVRESEAR